MIKTFKHKGLKKYFETRSVSGIQAKHQRKIRMQLAAIDTAHEVDDINLPCFNLHPLKGN
ncbi:type II toxin-antitoxin system RelE/ParE family toxin [Marinomonas spartinae]|uniref:type II toxin-antitoxin system RelE/ParE family toxin n=1 Tax=Marinomonas spartinae TaxID=1792290 RepID=UPI001FE2263F|nr:type II toxin-antitoxin system RelE/ParE family toxin [Marinomonas spartinae]